MAFLPQPDPVVAQLRQLSPEAGKFPSRRPSERRLEKLPDRLPGLIGCLGRQLVELLRLLVSGGRGAALDSTMIRACGGLRRKKRREKGAVPQSSIDTEAPWSKSGDQGWGSGWKLHLAVTSGSLRIPLAAELTAAHVAERDVAPKLLRELPTEARDALGDPHANTPEWRDEGNLPGREVAATRRGADPHQDGGVEVRQVFHKLRSQAVEPFNGLFKNVFEWRGQMPVKGLRRCRRLALGAIFVHQRVLRYQHQQQLPLGVGVKALLRAA